MAKKTISDYLSSSTLNFLQSTMSKSEYNKFVDSVNSDLKKKEDDALNTLVNNNTTVTTEQTSGTNVNNNSGGTAKQYSPQETAKASKKSTATSLDTYGIFNLPHQFNAQADPRYADGDWRGRCYNEHILSNAAPVIFKVGRPNYLDGGGDQGSLEALLNADTDEARSGALLNDLFGGNTSKNQTYYYTFEDDFNNYCKYVNGMVRFTAIKMNVNEFKNFDLNDTTRGKNSWWTDFFQGALGTTKYIAFYADGNGTSISESGSNSTGDSQLASGIKSLGQTKRELDFLFGKNTGANSDVEAGFNEYAESLRKSYTGIDGIDNVINKLAGTATSILSGANILFPEIWQDSSYRSNYSIEIHLSSPYGDKYSIMQNIYVPFLCLLVLALPRMSGKQGYTGPFLVQCFSKGWFSCNLGMVESIDVKRGGSTGKNWTIDSLPTDVIVTLSIKDLYPTMMATSQAAPLAFGNNVGLSEYLKMLAGVQLIDFNPTNNILEVLNAFENSFTDIPTAIYNKVQTKVGNGAKKLITKIFKGMN